MSGLGIFPKPLDALRGLPRVTTMAVLWSAPLPCIRRLARLTRHRFSHRLRLADLYLRQGLNSEARTNFLQVADHFIKKSDWENAASVLQRVIEVDPENASVEGRIADVYQKLGNSGAAFTAYLSSGRKARNRGALEEAEAYLKRALDLDGNNVQAVIQYCQFARRTRSK